MLTASACGSAEVSAAATTITTTASSTTSSPASDRIIPLDGTVAEVVFALGLGDQVVATDLSATYPPEADALPQIGYQRSLSAEPIAAFEPTVLIATDIAGPPQTLEDLRSLGYPVAIVPNEATPQGPGEKIRAVAEVLGVPARGEELAAKVDAEISAASVDVAGLTDRPRIAALYLRGESAQLVLGKDAATHWLIEAAGGIDVADSLDLEQAAPITAEALLAADPEVLLVTTTGLASVGGIEGLATIDALAATTAVQNQQVLAFDDQLLLGNGPRTGQLLSDLRAAIEHDLATS